jgi:hypothetical protein
MTKTTGAPPLDSASIWEDFADDVFTLWSVALIGVGLYVTARIGKDRAAMAAALVWVAGLVPATFAALRS